MNETEDKTTGGEDIFSLLGILMAFAAREGVDLSPESSNKQQQSASDGGNQNTLGVKTFVKDKAIEMYAKKTMENLKKNLKSSEPFVVGTMNKETIKDSEYDLTFQLNKVKVFNLGALEVKKFKSTSEKNMIEFAFAIPFVKLTSDYDVNGTFQKKRVQGKGDYLVMSPSIVSPLQSSAKLSTRGRIQINSVSIENGRLIVKETPQEIQIQELSLCYDFKDMSIKQSGLSVEGVEPSNVTSMLGSVTSKYLKDNKQKICNRIAAEMKSRANAQLIGKTRDQLGELMK